MKRFILAGMAILTSYMVASAAEIDMGGYVGIWEVDLERTLEEAKKSPKYDEETADQLPRMIKRMMESMTVEITATEMVYSRRGRNQALPYTPVSAEETRTTVSIKQGEAEATVVFELVDGKYFNFKSSVSDDMHYYIWRRVAGQE